MKKEAGNEQENRHDDSARLDCSHQLTETSSENRGHVLVSALATEYIKDECDYEYREFSDWYRAGEELDRELDSLKYYVLDCRTSLAEYSEPQQDVEHIEQIRTCIAYIPHNENFYCGTMEEASELLIDHCRESRIPTPTRIDYVINGYYMLWEFKEGLTRKELPVWGFIQSKLNRTFDDIGADAQTAQDATAMIYAPGFKNSDAVGFDLSDTIQTVHSGDVYQSLKDFVLSLPLSVLEIEEYRKTRKKVRKSAPKEEALQAEPDETARKKLLGESIVAALKVEGVEGESYRYRQYGAENNGEVKAEDKPKRRKYYDWLEVNSRANHYGLKADRDNWMSAALFGYMRNPYTGVDVLHKEERYAVSINCNFVILKWEKSELDYIPTSEQGKELVLSVCREYGLPEPKITDTRDGLEVKWYWRDRMTKENPYGASFNHDWDRMQEELYRIFWPLGAVDSRLKRGLSTVTTMFRVPGSLNTTKKLKTGDRVVRDIHEGETVSSYRDIQRILGLTPSKPERVNPEEVLMQEWEAFSREHGVLARDWMREVLRIHPATSRNWVCVGSIQGGNWKAHYTQASDLPRYLMRLVGTPEFSHLDLYVSQGEFLRYGDRKVSNLAEIRVNFVDLDYKLLKQYHPEITENPTAEEWKELVAEFCAEHVIPRHNAMVFTGGGVHLKWIYSEDAATSADLEAWQYAQKLLLEQFRTLGADPAAVDAARVLRLAGTQNQKANPEIRDRKVRVISAESQSERKITLTGFIEGLEASKPANPDVFNALVAEWRKRQPEQPKAEAKIISLDSGMGHPVVPEDTEADWVKTILRRKSDKQTYLRVKIGDSPEQVIETRRLREFLRKCYGTANVKVSLSELISANVKASPAYIPSNYVVLTQCLGATIEEQKENIFRRCDEYREVGIPRPNQIVMVGSTLLVEWKYSSRLPGYALARWKPTQEYLCRYFEDWGAMESPDYLTESVLLPVTGFEYENGETASLEYTAKREYSFDCLARAVLNFSQEEVRKYEEQKRKEKAAREAFRKLSKELTASMAKPKAGHGQTEVMSYKRLQDILTLLELRKDENGEVPQGTRELCVFWMMVFARQAGIVTTEEEFRETAQKFIEICGREFQTECWVETVMSAFRKNYRATTATLIEKLQITADEQKAMKVLIIGKDGKAHQPRAEWLAEHDQERRKPWIELGISRATYFRWKKAGKLPVQIRVYDPIPLCEEKSETGIPYIMTAAFCTGVIALCRRYLEGVCVRQVREKVPVGVVNSLGRCRRLRWLIVKSRLYVKRRRRSRPRRKRKRGCDG